MTARARKIDVAVVGQEYKVAIRNKVTGEVRVAKIEQPWGPGSHEWWTEGAMACDCARHETFVEAGEDEEEVFPYPSHANGVLYAVLWAEIADGRRIALDEPLVLH